MFSLGKGCWVICSCSRYPNIPDNLFFSLQIGGWLMLGIVLVGIACLIITHFLGMKKARKDPRRKRTLSRLTWTDAKTKSMLANWIWSRDLFKLLTWFVARFSLLEQHNVYQPMAIDTRILHLNTQWDIGYYIQHPIQQYLLNPRLLVIGLHERYRRTPSTHVLTGIYRRT